MGANRDRGHCRTVRTSMFLRASSSWRHLSCYRSPETTERFKGPTEVGMRGAGPRHACSLKSSACSSSDSELKISENMRRAVWRSSQPAARSAAIVGRQPAACSWARARLASSGGFGGRTRNRGTRHQLRQQFPGLVEMADPDKTHHAIGMGATKGWRALRRHSSSSSRACW